MTRQATLFPLDPEAAHDPGGKSRLPLAPGMRGEARFSPDGRYRTWLAREWDDATGQSPFALWIGMNPSTAGTSVNDPTVAREIAYTRDILGLKRYVKMNLCDYRTTEPKGLMAPGVEPRSPDNLAAILEQARRAERVILAHGLLPKPLRTMAVETHAALRTAGIPLWCLGTTADGTPRHPLYLKSDTPLVRFA